MKGSASSVALSEKGAKTGGGQMYGGVQALPLVKPRLQKEARMGRGQMFGGGQGQPLVLLQKVTRMGGGQMYR